MKRSILVLEHDAMAPRRTINGLVARERSVVVLRSPDLAQELILRCPDFFHLILLNATVSGAAGLCAELRRSGFRESIVIFDGATSEDALVDALEAGADDFLPRGCSIREAAGRIDARLRDADPHHSVQPKLSTRRT